MNSFDILARARIDRLSLVTLSLVPPLDGPECAAQALTPLLLQDVVAVVHRRRRGGHAVRLHHVHAAAAVVAVVVLDAVRVGADLDHRLHAHGVAAVKVLIKSPLSVKSETKNDEMRKGSFHK